MILQTTSSAADDSELVIYILVADDAEANQFKSQLRSDTTLSHLNLVVLCCESKTGQNPTISQQALSNLISTGNAARHMIIPDPDLLDSLLTRQKTSYQFELPPQGTAIASAGIRSDSANAIKKMCEKHDSQIRGISGSPWTTEEIQKERQKYKKLFYPEAKSPSSHQTDQKTPKKGDSK